MFQFNRFFKATVKFLRVVLTYKGLVIADQFKYGQTNKHFYLRPISRSFNNIESEMSTSEVL